MTKNELIEDLDLSKIQEEKKHEAVKKRLLELNAKKKNLIEYKVELGKKVRVINKKVQAKTKTKKLVNAKIRQLEKEKKKLPVINKEIKSLRNEKAKHERKIDKSRVMLDQLTLVIKETRLQEQQLRRLNSRLESMKKRIM